MAKSVDSELVIREVTKDIWTFSKPFARVGLFPFGGRSTAIKLSSGGVWVLASTPLTERTKQKLAELGEVEYICGADAEHTMFLAEYKNAYPAAKLIGIEAFLTNPSLTSLKFDGVYGKDPATTTYGFEPEVRSVYFSGYKNRDVAFLHAPSRTLVQADLLFNLPAHEQYSASAARSWFPFIGAMSPGTWLHKKLLWSLGTDREAMRRDAKAVAEWDFDRVIPCHGDVIEKDGKQAWEQTYRWYLQ